MTVETIHDLDQWETPCIDLERFGSIDTDEGFNAAMNDKAFEAQINSVRNGVDESISLEQMKGWLDSVQGLQVRYGGGEDGLINMVSDEEMLQRPDSDESLIMSIKDQFASWKEGIMSLFNDASGGVKNAEPALNEGGLLKDVVERNQNMEKMMDEASDVPVPSGMGN